MSSLQPPQTKPKRIFTWCVHTALVALNRVATHLENLQKSGNSKVVREKSGETEISVVTKGDQEMLSGDSRMQENLSAAKALTRTPLGELTALP